uniref:Uncharacterized protein n=2 Tax=Oryza TaxID=4527 RepID=Q33BH5_ORYSJ|nr:hypothetical protein LOC_Os10g01810 [Oryza sativa Japonica Group]
MAYISTAKLGDGGELALEPPYHATMGGSGEPRLTKGVGVGMVMASVQQVF